MKNKVSKIALSLVVLIIVSFSYVNSNFYIENQSWKYSNGKNIGDWFEKNQYNIKDRVIQGKHESAKIVFCFGFKLFIKDSKTGELGMYKNKS